MSLDLLVKLICIPLALYLVNALTAAKMDQSLSELAVSVQYEALRRDVAETAYAESFYNPNRTEDGLESDTADGVNYATPVTYFDDTVIPEIMQSELRTKGDIYALLDPNEVNGIRGYGEVLIAGGTPIEEEEGFFENALWGGTGTNKGTYFSGLSGIGDLNNAIAAGESACQPYTSIRNAQSRFRTLISQPLTGALKDKSQPAQGGNKLVDTTQGTETASSPTNAPEDLNVADLATLVQSTAAIAPAGQDPGAVDQCFIARARSILDYDQTAMAPVKQMPNLAYYNYFFSVSDKKISIEDKSARFSFLQKSEDSKVKEAKRERILDTARASQGKWNAF